MEKEYLVQLIEKKQLGRGNCLLTFSCPEIAEKACPGQFVNISCSRFLKRPFGVSHTDKQAGTFSVGVREVGAGTREIIEAKPGDLFEVLGPLGNGFVFDQVKKLIAVGGGTGVFPLHFALQEAQSRGIPTLCVNGFRSCSDTFFLEECRIASDRMEVSTDSGDYGCKGNVLDVLDTLTDSDYENAAVFTVGPEIMMNKVAKWALSKGLTCQVSLEKRMACGIGICLVCACKVKAQEENLEFHHVRCCKEGPVMDASEVVW